MYVKNFIENYKIIYIGIFFFSQRNFSQIKKKKKRLNLFILQFIELRLTVTS